jgi:hypothetical protein
MNHNLHTINVDGPLNPIEFFLQLNVDVNM